MEKEPNNNQNLVEEKDLNIPITNPNMLKKEKNKYVFQGVKFSKNSWYRKMANYLRIEKNEISLRRTPDEIRINYLKSFVQKNIKKATFFRLILPCVVFLVLSLVILWGGPKIQASRNLLNEPQMLFVRFLGGVFFLFGTVLLIKIIVFQEKVLMQGTDKRIKYQFLTKKQYQGVLDVFKKE